VGGSAHYSLKEEALDFIFEEANLDHLAVERKLERFCTGSRPSLCHVLLQSIKRW